MYNYKNNFQVLFNIPKGHFLQEKSPFLLTLSQYESCTCLPLLTSITTGISSEMASGAGQSSHSTSWTLVGMAPSARWEGGQRAAEAAPEFSDPHPLQLRAQQGAIQQESYLDPPWVGQGMPTTATRAPSLAETSPPRAVQGTKSHHGFSLGRKLSAGFFCQCRFCTSI